jgi:hypothetical protein
MAILGPQSYKKASGLPMRTSSTSKHENSSLFLFLGGNFCLPGSGSNLHVYSDQNPPDCF